MGSFRLVHRLAAALAPLLLVLVSQTPRAQGAVMSTARILPAAVRATSVAADDEVLTLSVALRLQNMTLLEDRLRAVSTPGSPDYGRYLDAADVAALFPADPASSAAVVAWLRAAGVTDFVDRGSHVDFAATVATANALLDASFAHFDVEGVDKLRTLQYSVPDALLPHVALVSPTTYFGRTVAAAPLAIPDAVAAAAAAAGVTGKKRNVGLVSGTAADPNTTVNCERVISPVCMERLYGYGDYVADPASGSRVGFGSFLNQSARLSDLVLYQNAFGLPKQKFTSVLINGGLDHQDPRGDVGEANLDLQFMSAVVKTLPITQFITGGLP